MELETWMPPSVHRNRISDFEMINRYIFKKL